MTAHRYLIKGWALLAAALLLGVVIYAARLVPNTPPNSADWRLGVIAVSTVMLAAGLVFAPRLGAQRVGSLLAGLWLVGALVIGTWQNALHLPQALSGERYSAHLQPALDLASISQAAPLAREHSDRALYLTMADYYRGCEIRLPSNSVLLRSKLAFWAQIDTVRVDPDIEEVTLPPDYANEVFAVAGEGRIHMPLAYQTAALPSPCVVTAHPVTGAPETHLVLRVTAGNQ